MAARDIDGYLAGVGEPKRSTLQQLRQCVLDVIPDAEECISYGLPAFKVQGKAVAGFGAFRNHLSYLPHSASALPELAADLAGARGGHQRVAALSREPAAPARLGEQAGHDPSAGAWTVGSNARRSNGLRARADAAQPWHK